MQKDSAGKDLYSGSVKWIRGFPNLSGTNTYMASGTNFDYSNVYTAEVTLTAGDAYTFSGVAANSFTHSDAGTAISGTTPAANFNATTNKTVINVADTGVVYIVFPATVCNLTSIIPPPIAECAIPATGADIGDDVYKITSTITWTTGGTAATGTFQPTTGYVADWTGTVTAANSFVFAECVPLQFYQDDLKKAGTAMPIAAKSNTPASYTTEVVIDFATAGIETGASGSFNAAVNFFYKDGQLVIDGWDNSILLSNSGNASSTPPSCITLQAKGMSVTTGGAIAGDPNEFNSTTWLIDGDYANAHTVTPDDTGAIKYTLSVTDVNNKVGKHYLSFVGTTNAGNQYSKDSLVFYVQK
jgi:hypothetical protein